MKKKYLAVIIAICMVLSVMPMSVAVAAPQAETDVAKINRERKRITT